MWLADTQADGAKSISVEVPPDQLREIKVFVAQARDAVKPGSTPFSFALKEEDGETAHQRTEFFGPEK